MPFQRRLYGIVLLLNCVACSAPCSHAHSTHHEKEPWLLPHDCFASVTITLDAVDLNVCVTIAQQT